MAEEVKSKNDIQALIRKHYLEQGSDSKNRELLEEGFELIKNRIMFNDKLDNGLNVSEMNGWINNFVRDKLGGTIDGYNISWEINGQTVKMNPMTWEEVDG